MKRGRFSVNTIHKILRIASGMSQLEVSIRAHTDQSTVSRMEKGELFIPPEMERNLVDIYGGISMVRMLIEGLQDLLDRIQMNNRPLMPA